MARIYISSSTPKPLAHGETAQIICLHLVLYVFPILIDEFRIYTFTSPRMLLFKLRDIIIASVNDEYQLAIFESFIKFIINETHNIY